MKLLILAPRFPYPTEKGDKLRMFHQIKELAKYNELVLCALTEEEVSQTNFKVVEKYCSKIYLLKRSKLLIYSNLLKSFFKNEPLQVGYFFDRNLQKQLLEIIAKEKPGHLYCQLFRTAEYIRKIPIPKTIDYQDTFSAIAKKWAENSFLPKRLILEREARKVGDYEAAIFHDFDGHTIISKQDLSLLTFKEKTKVQIIPNGVDTEFFQARNIPPKYDLAFVGNMGYPPNVAAAKFLVKEILPLVQKEYPKTKVLIAGARPTAEVQQLAGKSVFISGWINDIRTAYAESSIFVAPIFMGGGLQNKVLESLAMELPSIFTSQVNAAIGAKEESEALIANTALEFAAKIIQLKSDEDLFNKLKINGLNLVKERFSWEKTGIDLQRIFER